jgi:RNA polymerase sigma-70 factor, ECF subfamily
MIVGTSYGRLIPINRETVKKTGDICPFGFGGTDEEIVLAVKEGNTAACTALYDRYYNHVQRIICRCIGPDSELPDLVNEVFFQAIRSIRTLQNPSSLRSWLTSITIFTSRKCLRNRKRRNWLSFFSPEEIARVSYAPQEESNEEKLASSVRKILDSMPSDEQVVFSLRYLEGMDLTEIAKSFNYSVRTAKRKLAASEIRFKKLAKAEPLIMKKMESHNKWRNR